MSNSKLPLGVPVLLIIKLVCWFSASFSGVLLVFAMKDQGFDTVTTLFVAGLSIGVGYCAGGFLGGYLSDQWERSKVLHLTLFIWAISYFGLGLSQSLITFLFWGMMNGMLRGGFYSISYALIGDLSPKEVSAKIQKHAYASMNAGMGIGAGGALWLYSQYSFQWIMFGTGCIVLLVGGIALIGHRWITPEKNEKEPEPSFTQVVKVTTHDRALVISLVVGGMFALGFAQFETTLPLHIKMHDLIWLYPILQGINAVGVSLFLYANFASWVEKKIPRYSQLVWVSGFLFFFGFAFLGTSNVWTLITGMVLLTLAEAIFFPRWQEQIRLMGKAKSMAGTYLGTIGFTQLTYFVGPVIGGWILDALGGAILFVTIALIAVLSIPLSLGMSKQEKTSLLEQQPRDMKNTASEPL
ncbi:MFS transporter [Desmospora activa]|uniref:Putative MFS family arabinose efflux permease n=1 Tax=Desmospora activa DSM 45169 TaxID=1121389 RepID=A0A2T4YZ22_9BACL|nr:MFS transporter [Desmospora activa]PTM52200.1 putative MFS family arabinose efflux permease [Desmospora activa DSM 45169]